MTQPRIHLYNLLKHKPTLKQTKQIHAQIILTSLLNNNNLTGTLIQSYTAHNNLKSARKVFENYPFLQPSFLWNLIIQSYSKTIYNKQSLYLFKQMICSKVVPDDYTLTFTITACSGRNRTSFDFGQNCHAMVVKVGYGLSVCVSNALVSFYLGCLEMGLARKVFDEMSQRDVVTWTSLVKGYVVSGEMRKARGVFDGMRERNEVSWAVMIAGYVGNKMYNEGLRCFNEMLGEGGIAPNEAIFVSVLSACAHLGQVNQGKWIHFYMDKIGFRKSENIATALIDMYAKCGKIEYAKQVFKECENRDLLTWTSLISGLSMHGLGKEALEVFDEMLAEGIKPDNVTLIGVLSACSHSGKIEEGISIFNNMERLWGISPKIEHFGCYIDLLSRAGRLEDAFEVIIRMKIEPDDVIWRSLLSACKVHKSLHLAEEITKDFRNTHDGSRLLLSNLHASFGQWDNVKQIRETTTDRKDDSNPGCSYIEIDGAVHEFLAADKLHPMITDINLKLIEVMKRISLEGGYVPMTKNVLFDLSEEEKELAISWHSEKLAVAFALMTSPEGTRIQIVKNLRICEDCHSAMKCISLVYNREIVVRDGSRFHTFRDGYCSCADYW